MAIDFNFTDMRANDVKVNVTFVTSILYIPTWLDTTKLKNIQRYLTLAFHREMICVRRDDRSKRYETQNAKEEKSLLYSKGALVFVCANKKSQNGSAENSTIAKTVLLRANDDKQYCDIYNKHFARSNWARHKKLVKNIK